MAYKVVGAVTMPDGRTERGEMVAYDLASREEAQEVMFAAARSGRWRGLKIIEY